jgi:bromodomain adjacent to zinc finger domain protein 1A
LVWSCEITLKHGLTYEEATESEQEAREVVERVPQPIKRGIITLVHYTRHSRLDNLCDEVFYYIKDRYQEGEEVEVKYKGEKYVFNNNHMFMIDHVFGGIVGTWGFRGS